jgi:hypothetical protein
VWNFNIIITTTTHDTTTPINHSSQHNTTQYNMDSTTNTRLLNRVSAPYDFIDTDWVSQRIKDRLPNGRRSKLAAYFDGFMEFTHEPPSLSRSPSPEAERTSRSPVDSSSGQFRPSAKNLGAGWARRQQPRISTRRSTNASNSDPDLGSRKRSEFRF